MKLGFCNLSDVSHITDLYDNVASAIYRFHGAKPVDLSFKRNIINNITVKVPNTLIVDDITILAPIPSSKKTPSDCLVELMLALHHLRILGATSFHIMFAIAPFDGSGSRTSPTTPGFKMLTNWLNNNSDIRKITIFGPHSSHIEDMINVPRKMITHSDILKLSDPQLHDLFSGTSLKFISPDVGGYYNTVHIASNMTDLPVSCIIPGTPLPDDIAGNHVVLFDDMIVTGTKIMNAYETICASNPAKITIAITHVLHEQAVEVLHSLLDDPRVTVIISDTHLTFKHEKCIVRSITDHMIYSYSGTNNNESNS